MLLERSEAPRKAQPRRAVVGTAGANRATGTKQFRRAAPKPETKKRRPRAASIEGRRPEPLVRPRTALCLDTAPPEPTQDAELAVVGAGAADLTALPGAVVVRGSERMRLGAAAHRG